MLHYPTCCHCPLFSIGSVPVPWDLGHTSIPQHPRRPSSRGLLGAACMPQFLLLLPAAAAHHNLSNTPAGTCATKGRTNLSEPLKDDRENTESTGPLVVHHREQHHMACAKDCVTAFLKKASHSAGPTLNRTQMYRRSILQDITIMSAGSNPQHRTPLLKQGARLPSCTGRELLP